MFGVAETVDPTWSFYAANLRTGLFTGFLTISSFLLAMTTFVIMNLKAQYYDLPAYTKRVKKRRETGCKRTYYRPLQNLGAALLVSICLTLTASLSQFTPRAGRAFVGPSGRYAMAEERRQSRLGAAQVG